MSQEAMMTRQSLLHWLWIATIVTGVICCLMGIVPGRGSLFIPILIMIFLVMFCTIPVTVIIPALIISFVVASLFFLMKRNSFLKRLDAKWRSELGPLLDRVMILNAIKVSGTSLLFLIVLADEIPATIGFCLSRSAFETSSETIAAKFVTMSSDEREVELSRNVFGIYHVDAIRIDKRGGIYYRVSTGYDGIFDMMSYGFAKNPNQIGSPFGRASYSKTRIVGDWYVFQASNDYY
jgi:hypothetical protein